MFNKIFPDKVEGRIETTQSIENLEKSIEKVSENHKLTKTNNEFIIIPKGVINFLGISNPMRNYKKIILKLIPKNDNKTSIEYICYRKFSKSTSVLYLIFLIMDIALITFSIISINSDNETLFMMADLILGATVFWVGITIMAFIFDYFVLLSKGAVDRGFRKNILSRILRLSEKLSQKNL